MNTTATLHFGSSYSHTAKESCVSRRKRSVHCKARGSTPYEPLERAIQVINRVISVGERAGWGAAEVGDAACSTEDRQLPERWVAFGATSIAQVAVVQPVLLDGSLAAPAQSRNLRDYLQLPPSEYSLLDPKWVDRLGDNVFKLTVPLSELLGVDLTPEVLVEARSDPVAGTVTIMATKAAVGSPAFDQAVRVELTAVLSHLHEGRRGGAAAWVGSISGSGDGGGGVSAGGSSDAWDGTPTSSGGIMPGADALSSRGEAVAGHSCGEDPPNPTQPLAGRRGLGSLLRRPRQLPGRPVYRLRRLAARARGREWPPAAGPLEGAAAPAAPLANGAVLFPAPARRPPAAAVATAMTSVTPTAAAAAGVGLLPPPSPPPSLGSSTDLSFRPPPCPPYQQPQEWSPPEGIRPSGVPSPDCPVHPTAAAAAAAASWDPPALSCLDSDDYDEGCAALTVRQYEAPHHAQPARAGPAGGGEQVRLQQEAQQGAGGAGAAAGAVPAERLQLSADSGAGCGRAGPGVGRGEGCASAAQRAQQDPAPGVGIAPTEGLAGEGQECTGVEADLGCRVRVRISARVPAAVRVVPNALLGYTGRLLLQAVLSAALPNFMDLLAADYQRWARAGRRGALEAVEGGGGAVMEHPSHSEGRAGSLFSTEQGPVQ